jgi:hypothetical protein
MVHLESHHEAFCKCYADMTSYKDNINDVKLSIENEVKEDKGSSLYLNIGNKYNKPENSSLNIDDGFKLFGVNLQMHSI